MRDLILVVVALLSACLAQPYGIEATPKEGDPKLVLVTIDGLRWQEVFRGADAELAANKTYVERHEHVARSYIDVSDRAAALMPFLQELAQQGVLIGNRDAGSCAEVTNPWWFSYPGYNEILSGHADAAIDSNDKVENPNLTFLEWLEQRADFAGAVAAFGSWDVFPYIINEARSGVPVNAGFEALHADAEDGELRTLNRLQSELPSPWETVRFDAFTHEFALWTLRHEHPRAVYIAYGETDDFAHDGKYDAYLDSAHRSDGFLRELWQTLQSDPYYAGQTSLLVTTDHGRGDAADESWRSHASPAAMRGPMKQYAEHFPDGIRGSDQTWIAAIGPQISAADAGQYRDGQCAHNAQMAATALRALQLRAADFSTEAEPALNIFK